MSIGLNEQVCAGRLVRRDFQAVERVGGWELQASGRSHVSALWMLRKARGCQLAKIIMQHIGVVRENEKGEVIAAFDNGESIDLRIVTEAPAQSCCLRFIDPYGNFVINRYQLPVLISELNELSLHSSDPGLKSNIRKLVAFLEDESGEPHIYIKFMGD